MVTGQDIAPDVHDGALCQERLELCCVSGPVLVFPVGKQYFVRRRQLGMMLVGDAKALLQQESQIIFLCIAK